MGRISAGNFSQRVFLIITLILGLAATGFAASLPDKPAIPSIVGNSSDVPYAAPQGEPESDLVKQMQSLFNERKPASPSSALIGPSRGMTVQGMSISPTPAPVTIWSDREVYSTGDTVRLYVRIPAAAYVYVLNVDTAGELRVVFPNMYDRDSYFNAAGTYSLPRNSRYTYPVAGSSGYEHLMVIASSERVSYLDRLSDRGGDFPLIDDHSQMFSMLRDWIRGSAAWSSFGWNSFRLDNKNSWPGNRSNKTPVARIQASASRATVGFSVNFSSNGSYDPDGSIRAYRWDVNNDGRVDASGESIRWAFTTPGTYTVRLTVEDNYGASESATVQIVIEAPKTLLEIETSKTLSVYVDNEYVGKGSVKQYVTPGAHTVKITGPSGQVFTTVVTVASGMRNVKLEANF